MLPQMNKLGTNSEFMATVSIFSSSAFHVRDYALSEKQYKSSKILKCTIKH